MSKNPFGVIRRGPQEWGRQARQDEDRARGMRRRGREQSIAEQIEDIESESE